MPTTASGRDVAAGDLVDIEIAGVGREDGAGLGDLVELAENVLLDVHVLEHRLDDEVGVLQVVKAERRGEAAHARFDFLHREAALLGAVLVILADDGDAAVERLLLHFNDRHRNADAEEVHRDAAAHGAGADDADRFDRQRLHVRRQAVDLGGLALGEEDMALGGRLQPAHQLHEFAALDLHAFFEGQGDGGLDALDVGFGCFKALEGAGVGLAEIGEHRRQRWRRRRPACELSSRTFFSGRFSATILRGEGHRAGGQVAIHHFVDQADGERVLRPHRRAAGHHLQRLFRADDARQPLGAAGAGQQAELDFGQAASSPWRR